jgi:hypothetical protein
MISAPMGVRLAGLSTNGQPTASAGATLCAARLSGKLNGEERAVAYGHALKHAAVTASAR